MDIEIIAVGGYDEVGRNMTAVRCGKEIVIFDMGLRLDQVMIHEDAEIENMHSLDLIKIKAIPDDTMMNAVEGTVKAIVCSHGHLDHIGAIPKLAHRYNAPIIATPYTTELIRQQISGEQKFGVNNKLFALKAGQRFTRSPRTSSSSLSAPSTRSSIRSPRSSTRRTVPSSMPATSSSTGARSSANPRTLPGSARSGRKACSPSLLNVPTSAGKAGARASGSPATLSATPSRAYEDDKNAIIVSTFSSHISRVKTIAECAHEIGRKPVLLGRSMEKYCGHRRADETRLLPRDHQCLREPADGRPDHAPDDEGGQGEVPAHCHRAPGRAGFDPHPYCARGHPLPGHARATRSSSRLTSSRTR